MYRKACLLVVAIAGMAMPLLSTRLGPGVGGDATVYLYSARNLAEGFGLGMLSPDGILEPLAYYPPLLPLALAAPVTLGWDLTSSARILNVLLFGAFVFLSGLFALRITRSLPAGLVLETLVILSPLIFPAYSWVMAEPLAMLFGFWGLERLAAWYENNNHKNLALAGIFQGLSMLARYASIGFLAGGVLSILFQGACNWRRRLGNTLRFLGTGLAPSLAWAVWLGLTTHGAPAARSGVTVADALRNASEGLHLLPGILLSWILPESLAINPPYPNVLNGIFLALFLAGLGALAWVSVGPWRIGRREKTTWLLIFTGAAYLCTSLAAFVFTYPHIDLNNRILLPVYACVLWLAAIAMHGVLENLPWKALKMAALAAVLLFIAVYGWRGWKVLNQNRLQGLGYNSLYWRSSDTIAALRSLPETTPIVTDEVAAILYLTGRRAYRFQEIDLREPLETFHRFGDGELQGDPGQAAFRRQGAALVLFEHIEKELALVYGERAHARFESLTGGLNRTFWGKDGFIFFYGG